MHPQHSRYFVAMALLRNQKLPNNSAKRVNNRELAPYCTLLPCEGVTELGGVILDGGERNVTETIPRTCIDI